jgi:hypothetical protein
MIITRSASPSRLMPRSAPWVRTASMAASVWVEPTPALMLKTSG